METWGDIQNRQEREKEQLRVGRTLAWEKVKAENPNEVPAPVMARWRAEYGDQVMANMDARHKQEHQAYFKMPEQAQTVEVTKDPKSLEQIQTEQAKKSAFREQAEEILKRNQEQSRDRSKDRGRD